MNVLLIDDDADFRKRFSTYTAENCSSIMLTVCDGERAGDELENKDLILVDERAEAARKLKESSCADRTVILVRSRNPEEPVSVNGVRSVFKYLSAPSLISSIPELAEIFDDHMLNSISGSLTVTGVMGYGGGSGRTCFALMLARLNQQIRHRNTLLITTDRHPDLGEYFHYPAGSVSDIDLLLLNYLSGFKIVPSRFLMKDPWDVHTFVLPVNGANDIRDLTAADAEGLMRSISEWNMFDDIILDIGKGDHEADRAMLAFAERVYVLHDARRKTVRSERRWVEKVQQSVGRMNVTHIMNFAGLTDYSEEDETLHRYEGQMDIPFDPDSFTLQDGIADISMTGHFSSAVSYVLKRNEYLL